MQREELGALLGYSAASIASFEQGRRIPPPKFIEGADRVLDAGGVLLALKEVIPMELEEHAGLEGPFTLIDTRDERRIAYVESYKDSRLHTERASVRELDEQYGILRAQALTPRESLATLEKLLGER